MKPRLLGTVIAVGLTAMAFSPAQADFLYWTGAVSTNWNNPANWSIGALPGSLDTTVVVGNPVVQQPVVSSPAPIGYLVRLGDTTASASPAPLSGTLTIDANGALVLNRYLAVGYSNNSSGLLTVSGPSASLAITTVSGIGALYVGLGSASVGR